MPKPMFDDIENHELCDLLDEVVDMEDLEDSTVLLPFRCVFMTRDGEIPLLSVYADVKNKLLFFDVGEDDV